MGIFEHALSGLLCSNTIEVLIMFVNLFLFLGHYLVDVNFQVKNYMRYSKC